MQPLIVSLKIDTEHQDELDAQRRRWFPAERLAVGAHVTLFHALPGARLDEVESVLDAVCAVAPFEVDVTEVVPLGSGVAYRIRSARLDEVHAAIRREFADVLTRQDAQGFRPHVTVQNKVTAAEARSTLATVRASFVPYRVRAEGLELWRYAGGPWEPVRMFAFDAG